MFELVTSVTVATVLSIGTAAPRPEVRAPLGPIAVAAATAFPAVSAAGTVPSAALRSQTPAEKDSLRNGAIAGAIAGGVSGALLGSVGCGVASSLDAGWGGSDTSSSCTGAAIIVAALGAGLGAAIGAGVDAMFEQAPYAGPGTGGKRKGVRLRWRF